MIEDFVTKNIWSDGKYKKDKWVAKRRKQFMLLTFLFLCNHSIELHVKHNKWDILAFEIDLTVEAAQQRECTGRHLWVWWTPRRIPRCWRRHTGTLPPCPDLCWAGSDCVSRPSRSAGCWTSSCRWLCCSCTRWAEVWGPPWPCRPTPPHPQGWSPPSSPSPSGWVGLHSVREGRNEVRDTHIALGRSLSSPPEPGRLRCGRSRCRSQPCAWWPAPGTTPPSPPRWTGGCRRSWWLCWSTPAWAGGYLQSEYQSNGEKPDLSSVHFLSN